MPKAASSPALTSATEMPGLTGVRPGSPVTLTREEFARINLPLLERIGELADEAILQAGTQPEAIFVTGGTARSPVIHHWLQTRFADSRIVVGDHFGSVIAGLARWAERYFEPQE